VWQMLPRFPASAVLVLAAFGWFAVAFAAWWLRKKL